MAVITVDSEISIRPPAVTDAKVLFDLIEANREYLRRSLPWPDSIRTVADERAHIERVTDPEVAQRSIGGLIVYRDEVVGAVAMSGLGSVDRAGEIGYWLIERVQGNGIITRCCRTIIDLAFRQHGMHRVQIRAAVGNTRSRNVPVRLGFTYEGVQRQAALVAGEFHDLAVYSILSHEWPAAVAPPDAH